MNPGQVGIYIAGGTNNQILNNTIYGAPRTNSNVGIYVWNLSGGSCSGSDVKGNRVYFRKADGSEKGYWEGARLRHRQQVRERLLGSALALEDARQPLGRECSDGRRGDRPRVAAGRHGGRL